MQHTKRSTAYLVKRLIAEHVSRYKKHVLLAIVAMVIAAAMTAANAYMMQPVLDEIFIDKDKSKLFVLPLLVIGIAAIAAFANYAHTLAIRYVGQRIIADMQVHLFAHLLSSDLQLFHDQSSGRLISRFTNDIQMMRQAVSNGLTTLAKEFLTMIFLIGVMMYQNLELSLISLLVFPVAVYPIIRLGKRMRKISDTTQHQLGEFTASLDEVFQGVRTVKAYGRENREAERAGHIIERLFSNYFRAARVQAVASPMMECLSGIVIAAVIWYGGLQVIEGTTSAGAFFSFITAFLMAYRPLKSVAGLNTVLQEGLAAANRLFDVLDTKPRIVDAPNAQPLKIAAADIRFEEVSFYYPPGSAGVKDINLHVPAGKKVALVGFSGAGKSTLVNLLLRFYDTQSGRIIIDGQNIKDITQYSLREAMAYVAQETALFDDTVRANIAYGRAQASDEEIEQAAKDAAAHEFIIRLPKGYDTMVGAGGVRLSGGQRQRLAIARAMLKNAPILLLDEATSSLDNTSESLIQEALSRLMKGRTTLIIAHRLSTIIHADIIYVLDHGRVVESGTHAELLAKQGAYHRLYASPATLSTVAS